MNVIINQIIEEYSHQNGVISILLAGSRTGNLYDSTSDYDIYIYSESLLPVVIREGILLKHCKQHEINNTFWETEDNIVLLDGTPVDIIYRDPNWLTDKLNDVVIRHNAATGYTTAIWYNIINSKILYDTQDCLKRIQSNFNVEYPEQLKINIINKNLPLITTSIPSYIFQIEKAVNRRDYISINHRITEYLASYFDILFAINKIQHPGEKKLIRVASKMCNLLPKGFKTDIIDLLTEKNITKIPDILKRLSDNLVFILEKNIK